MSKTRLVLFSFLVLVTVSITWSASPSQWASRTIYQVTTTRSPSQNLTRYFLISCWRIASRKALRIHLLAVISTPTVGDRSKVRSHCA